MSDRELLELAAKAAGFKIDSAWQEERDALIGPEKASLWIHDISTAWNPLRDDGDALRLAVKLRMDVTFNDLYIFAFPPDGSEGSAEELNVEDPYAATRRSIVRAAAEIGRAMQ